MSSIEDFLHSIAYRNLFSYFNHFMAEPLFYVVVVVFALLAVLVVKKKGTKAAVIASLLLTGVLVLLLKSLYAEPRPCVGLSYCEPDFGFPSGHAALSFAVAFNTFGTNYFYYFIAFAVLVALSRVISGLHTFPQIVAGMILGFIVSTTVNLVVQKIVSK